MNTLKSASESSTTQSANETLDGELISLLSKQGKRVPYPVFISALLIAFLASDYVPFPVLIGWLSFVLLILITRHVVLGNLPAWTHISEPKRIQIAILLSAINGTAHGVSNFFFPTGGAFEHAMQTMLLLGLCAGSVATTAGHRGIFHAYLLPTTLTNAASWLYLSLNSQPLDMVFLSVSVLVMMFTAVLFALGRDTRSSFVESFEIRSQQAETNRKLELALSEAESANNAKTRFLASASHDLRQPIHTLSLLGASLAMRPLDERSKQISTHINTALDSLATQLDSLLDISKLDAGIVETNDSTVDISSLCRRLAKEFATPASNKGLFIKCEVIDDAIVYTDSTLLERVLRNLVSNAIKYTETGGITIQLEHYKKTNFRLTIIDTGIGIPEDDQSLIFEEFYQVDNPERDRNKGLGLGLAIVKRLIKLLKVGIEIQSKVGIGTRFSLIIEPALHSVSDNFPIKKTRLDWPSFNILVIDDEAMVRFAVETLLLELGAQVALADSTKEALERAKANPPNLILADFRLRGNESGLDTIKALHRLYPDVPAILISGDTGPTRLQLAKEAGIPFLHKPVKIEELEEALLTFAKPGHTLDETPYEPDQTFTERHTLKRL